MDTYKFGGMSSTISPTTTNSSTTETPEYSSTTERSTTEYSSTTEHYTTEYSSTTEHSTTEYSSTTETPQNFDILQYYIIIVIPSVLICVLLIILFIIIIRKIMKRKKFDLKQLETYSSVNYDDEIDEELEVSDDMLYSSCRLLVGPGYEDNASVKNDEPEYDCMSVDVTVSAKESAIVDWRKNDKSTEASQELPRSLKTLPHNFWKR